MTEKELEHVRVILIEVVNLRHENVDLRNEKRNLRDAIELHKTQILNEYGEDQVKGFDRILWEVLK